MRLALIATVTALALAGCGTDPSPVSSVSGPVEQAQPEEAVPEPEAEEPTPAAIDPQPWLDLECPVGGTAPAHVTFGWTGDWQGEPTVVMDYGDGKTYTAVGAADVEADAFEHTYRRGGVFTVTATVTDGQGQSADASCVLDLAAPVVQPAPDAADYGMALQDLVNNGGSGEGCYRNGHRLYGTVRVVEFGGDLTVRRVDFGGDLRVQQVKRFANSCGRWQFVEFGGDLTVRFVEFGGDLTVRFVDYNPGMN